MVDNLYTELNDRSKLIFKKLVESYLKTGSPAGSETIMKMGGFNLSSASIRSILSDLQKEGLLYAPHRSAGRMPTEKGMRFFVDGLLEFGRISKSDKENIKQQCSTKGKSYEEVLDVASRAISGLSNYAGIVIAPKFQKNLKHLEFIRINKTQLMLILAYENGEVENRIIEDNGKYNNSLLIQASNYLTSKFTNKNISQIKKLIQTDIKKSQNQLEIISSNLVNKGIIENPPNIKNPYIFLHGQ